MDEKLKKISDEFRSLEERLSGGGLSPQEIKDFSRRRSELAPAMRLIEEQDSLLKELADWDHLSSQSKDGAERLQIDQEKSRVSARLAEVDRALDEALIPKDPDDAKNIYLELRAAAGGDESALFAAELLRLYTRFADLRGWKAELVEMNATGLKGVKSAILYIQGQDAFAWLRFEGGVHRVQRVPATEASGRIHTSTVTVAVMPEASEVEVSVDPKDLRVDTYRAGGHGGQNVNKVETAIRITHLPSGIVVQCQDERSQLKNRLKAMSILRAKLAEAQREEAASQNMQMRRTQVGSGDRSEKIRTYNFPQNRLTDHRLERSWHSLPEIMDGQLSPVLEALREERMKELRDMERTDKK